MNTIVTLLRREYWENRGNFAIAPLSIGAFFIIIFVFALFNTEHLSITHGYGDSGGILGGEVSGLSLLSSMTVEFANLPLESREKIWETGFFGIGMSFTWVLILVSFIYMLGSLYDDRKDRSILFWKSLPISDLMTVNSKILTVLFVIPAFFLAATALTYLLIMVIITLVALLFGINLLDFICLPAPFISGPLKLYFNYIIQTLWAAPFLGWLLLVSSWTKRKPILLATIPLAVISFLEFYYYRTNVFSTAVKERIFGWMLPTYVTHDGVFSKKGDFQLGEDTLYYNAHTLLELQAFWLGLIVAAVMVAASVFIRRYRDDS